MCYFHALSSWRMQPHTTSRIPGLIVLCLGCLLLAGRAFGVPGLLAMLPGGERMGLLNMVMLALSGYAVASVSGGWRALPAARRASVIAAMAVLALLSCGYLLEA